ncbi:putative membrane protein [Pedobacter sp. UYP24]
MYNILLPFHSMIRWLVLASLIYSIYISFIGYTKDEQFTQNNDRVRHWTATIAHIQLILGILIYTKSMVVKAFFSALPESSSTMELFFFGVIHIFFMLIAIVLITIGSAKAKRQSESKDKFKTILICFSIALLIILLAIPWPFSPLSNRPYIRTLN